MLCKLEPSLYPQKIEIDLRTKQKNLSSLLKSLRIWLDFKQTSTKDILTLVALLVVSTTKSSKKKIQLYTDVADYQMEENILTQILWSE